MRLRAPMGDMTPYIHQVASILPATVLLLAALAPAPAGADPALAQCVRAFEAAPQDRTTVSCFHDLASDGHRTRETLRQIEQLVRQGHAGNPWLRFTEGRIRAVSGERGRAAGLYRMAAAGFAAGALPAGEAARGELAARGNLWRLLVEDGALWEARFEMERARRAVEAAGNPPGLRARADLLEAKQLFQEGGDLERAVSLLQAGLPVDLEPAHRFDLLETLGEMSIQLLRLEAGRQAYEKAEQLAGAPGDEVRRARALYGRTRIELEKLSLLPASDAARGRVRALARETLAAAESAGASDIEAVARLVLAQTLDGQEREDLLSGCLALDAAARQRSHCLVARAEYRASTGRRQEALADLARARALAEGLNVPSFQALLLSSQIQVSWAVEPARAIQESWKALEAIEALRRRQGRGSPVQASLFAGWTYPYHQFAGHLFRTAGEHPERLEMAFSVLERQHARALRDAVHGPSLPPPPALEEQRREIERAKAAVSARQRDPAVPPGERRHAADDLRRLTEERARLADLLEEPGRVFSADFAGLGEVRDRLAPDEALLAFQVAPAKGWTGYFAGGSWLVVLTRTAPPRLYALPEREKLRTELSIWESAIAGDDPAEPRRAAELYRLLVGRAVAELPPQVGRLIVIPDDHLHRLPWAALRRDAGGPPLVERYEIALTPSATLWRDQRRRPPPPPRRAAALIFAAPALQLELSPLPEALREGRDVRRALDGDSLLLAGERAVESALTAGTVARFSVLHFATHSEVNERHPEKSAVHLAAAGGQDGRLTPAEISRLPLDGRLVVLSSCEGQAGRVLLGEGAMSLARAFFQGRARTVVASLWKVRDDDARLLSASFYRHLSAGESAAAALAAAQRERARAGAPTAAWAGLTVLGDGNLAPVAAPRWGWVGPLLLVAAAALGGLRGALAREIL